LPVDKKRCRDEENNFGICFSFSFYAINEACTGLSTITIPGLNTDGDMIIGKKEHMKDQPKKVVRPFLPFGINITIPSGMFFANHL
jgi:hypothetical protein